MTWISRLYDNRNGGKGKGLELGGRRQEAGVRKQQSLTLALLCVPCGKIPNRKDAEKCKGRKAQTLLPPVSCLLPPASCLLPPASSKPLKQKLIPQRSGLAIGISAVVAVVLEEGDAAVFFAEADLCSH